MEEGGVALTSVFLPCLFRLPAVMGERKKKEKTSVDVEEEWEGKKGPQQMLIRSGGWVFGQLSTKSTLKRGSNKC